jgi:hypothetical protein
VEVLDVSVSSADRDAGRSLYLGTFGFGGPVALIGFMHRDLVERRRWIDEDEYRLGAALAQIMPGPLAAQLAIALRYFHESISLKRTGTRCTSEVRGEGVRPVPHIPPCAQR